MLTHQMSTPKGRNKNISALSVPDGTPTPNPTQPNPTQPNPTCFDLWNPPMKSTDNLTQPNLPDPLYLLWIFCEKLQ